MTLPPSGLTSEAACAPDESNGFFAISGLSLSEEQAQAVRGPLASRLVLAGPGAGKTRALACRAAYVIACLKVPAASVLAVTYTNKATEEMRARLGQMLPAAVGRPTIGTFHGFCIQLLRRRYAKVGLPECFGVADEAAQIMALKRLKPKIQEQNAKDILRSFSQARIGDRRPDSAGASGDLASPEDFLRATNPFFAEYQNYLRQNGLIDFDDILTLTERLLDDREALAEIRSELQFILVDEFQDTDAAQYAILRRLALERDAEAKAYRNVIPVFAVADDDQSIFAWRGARPENIRQFYSEFLAGQESAVVRLETNYRCSGNIVAAANRLLERERRLWSKTPRAYRDDGDKVCLYRYADDRAEIEGIAEDIRAKRQAGIPFSRMAVLYRRHETGEAFESALLSLGIPCQIVRRQGLYDAPEVKRMLLLMRATLNPEDDLALSELIGAVLDDALRVGFEQRCQSDAASHRAPSRQALRRTLRAALNDSQKVWRDAASRIVGLLDVGKACLDSAKRVSDWIAAAGAFLEPNVALPPLAPADDIEKAALWLTRLSELEGALVVAGESPLIEEAAALLLRQTIARQGRFRIFPRHALGDSLPHEKTVLLSLNANAEESAKARWKLSAIIAIEREPGASAAGSRARTVIRADALPIAERGAQPSRFVALWKLARAYLAKTLRPLFSSYVVVDLETTDKQAKQCDIVELAAARVQNAVIRATYSQLIQPTLEPIAPEAQKTHGITPEMVADAPTFAAVAPAFLDFLGDDLLIAHNGLKFDFPILRRRLGDVGCKLDNPLFDTLPFARQLYADHPAIKRFRLGDLAAFYGVDTGTAHRALDDARTLAEVFERMQADYNRRRSDALGADTLGALALAMLLEMGEAEASHSLLFQAGAATWRMTTDDGFLALFAVDPLGAQALKVWRKRAGETPAAAPPRHPAATLAAIAKRYDDLPLREAMAALLDFTRLFTPVDTWRDCDAVTLMTMHAAKGLEFGYVWLPALEDRRSATGNARQDAKKLEEERRLLYVALTRAEEQVSLSWAARRGAASADDPAGAPTARPLPFLSELGCVETVVPSGEEGSATPSEVT
ncbi:MAG: hypothetical protein CFK52_01775 [Chloracidobacterium sp. CP2_5A]|nr:MAG: hypothetical protein CFK52_01775 [Chloracidobacterium sp. CP2_5A]